MSRGHVVISGASTGIGEACARHLASIGFHVFAGVRKDADAQRLAAAPGIDPLRLDVADDASVAAAAESVRGQVGSTGVAGIVNNAGIAVAAPLEYVDIEDFRRQLDVNVTGVLRTTQAFLPLLREAHGRIVNISSIGGRVAIPMVGPYNTSKFAVEGLSDALRRELRPWGMHVAVIEPGAIATPIWEKSAGEADGMLEHAPAELTERYGEIVDAIRAQSIKNAREGNPPEDVAKAVAHALTAARPKTRYLVGRDARARAPLAKVLPDRVMDAAIARALGQRKRV